MNLRNEIRNYKPYNEQEKRDKEQMLSFMERNPDFLERSNLTGHFSASVWVLNKMHTKVLMVYHNLYDSWSWVGGHADGEEDLRSVALRELEEETGVKHAKLVMEDIFSLETLTVNGHKKRGIYVPSHLHFNITYLVEAEETESLRIKEDENQGVKWWSLEEAVTAPKEAWMVEWIYKKLLEKCRNI